MKHITIPDVLYKKLNTSALRLIEEGAYLIETIADECSTNSGYKSIDFIEQYEQRLQHLLYIDEKDLPNNIEDMQLNINYIKSLNEKCEYIKETMYMINLKYYNFLI